MAEIVTFGCRLNSFESSIIQQHAEAAGLNDVVVVHGCAVTAEAERQARQAIRRLQRERPDARIVVTGCGAQINPEAYAALPGVTHVVGNEEKLKPETWHSLAGGEPAPAVLVNDIMAVKETAGYLVEGFDQRTRAFVQVQQGCDHRCTFCIIPYGRGNARSVPIGEIVAQTRRLVEAGYQEIAITGVDITSFGKDLPGQPSLGQMLRRLVALVPELPRLRLSSIDPAEVDADLRHLLATEPRLLPHLHLSLQAGDTMILKRMKRRHSREDALRLADELRDLRPDLVLGADLIAGFPTEDEAMFANTLALVDDLDLLHLHVFPYSPRAGTPAARMPQVDKAVRKERAARLRAAGAKRRAAYLRGLVGRDDLSILVEADNRGHSQHFAPVRFTHPTRQGQIVRARGLAVTDDALNVETLVS